MDTSNPKVSSSSSSTSTAVITDSTQHDNHNVEHMEEIEGSSTSAEALSQIENNVQNGISSTDIPACQSQSNEVGDTCVSSQQMGSSNSDKNENEDNSEDCDDQSDISEFSDFSQESWQPVQGPIAWVQEKMRQGQSPRRILEDLVPSGTVIPSGLDTIMLWKIIISIVSEPPKRKKLKDINTLDDVLRLLKSSKKIIVLTGAGVSVSCGIPDFRSQDGVYARLAQDFPNLPDPQAMFDIHFFRSDPRPFFKFAREIYPGQFKPSPCHYFIRMLEEKGKLLRNYTQNIDTLEQVAGIQRVIQCHGSFATASCTICGHKVDSDAVKDDIFNQVIPHCPRCSPSDQSAVMKPDIVFFGESLPEHFHNQMAEDRDECDLLIVIGSSLKVRPVALIPNSLPADIPQILINRERLHYLNFDVELLGNCDDIIGELCRRLGAGWEELAAAGPPINEVLLSSLPTPPASPHSGESIDIMDDADNPTISSSEATMISSTSKHDFHSLSKEHPEQILQSDDKSEHQVASAKVLNTCEDDNGVQVVSTSQSETSLTKIHKGHYHHQHNPSPHRHSLKRPYMSPNTATEPAPDPAVSNIPGSDQAPEGLCSSKDVETLVSACHKKDIMYIPTEKSSHGYHSQHSHDRAKSHHHHTGQSLVHEQSRSPKHNCQPSADLQNASPNYSILEHNSDFSTSESSKEVSTDQKMPAQPAGLQIQSSEKTDQMSPSCSTNSVAADLKKRVIDDDGCPKVKRRRLNIKGYQEGENTEADVKVGDTRDDPGAGVSSACDSQSREGSLDDLRKMWHSRCRVSLAQRLTDNQVLFLPPSCYVFKGAEVFSGSDSEDSDDSDYEDDSDDAKESSDEDRMTVDTDTDKVSEIVPVSTDKSDDREKEDSSRESEKCSHQQQLIPSACFEDAVEKTNTDLPVQKTSAAIAEVTSGFSESNISVQPSEREPSTDIPCSQNKVNDGSAACPVSSTEDFTLGQTAEVSSGLHVIQNQRD